MGGAAVDEDVKDAVLEIGLSLIRVCEVGLRNCSGSQEFPNLGLIRHHPTLIAISLDLPAPFSPSRVLPRPPVLQDRLPWGDDAAKALGNLGHFDESLIADFHCDCPGVGVTGFCSHGSMPVLLTSPAREISLSYCCMRSVLLSIASLPCLMWITRIPSRTGSQSIQCIICSDKAYAALRLG